MTHKLLNKLKNVLGDVMNMYEALVMTSAGQTKVTVQAESTFQAKALLEQIHGKSSVLSVPIEIKS